MGATRNCGGDEYSARGVKEEIVKIFHFYSTIDSFNKQSEKFQIKACPQFIGGERLFSPIFAA